MARRQFNMDTIGLDKGWSLMAHGGRAAGKTHLLGDCLATEAALGKVRFVNVLGEDGMLTCQGMGIAENAETVECYEDFLDMCKEYKGQLQAVALDSVSVLSKWVMKHVLKGLDRLPRITKEGNEWGDFHREMDNAMLAIKQTAKYVICSCPSDRSVDQLTGQTYTTPDLHGRQAVGSAGWFDFVGMLKAESIGPGKTRRTFIIAPNSNIIVRQRLPRQINADIELADGPGGWKKIKDMILLHSKVAA